MATADPGSDPASLFGVSDKLQSKVNSFREMIERKKSEVRRVSKEMRSLIETKEEAIIRELNAIWEEVNSKLERKKIETQKVIEAIETLRKEMEKKFRKILTSIQLNQISEQIEKAKSEMDIDIPNVKLTWRVDELKDCINRMCRCDQQILVYNEDTQYQLKWSTGNCGDGDNQLCSPWGIATNPMNDNIYVADKSNHRVQIFSREGEWIRSVKDEEMKYPQNILFHNQSIYVLCNRAILKLNAFTEEKEKYKSYYFNLGGICTDNIHIYVGQCEGMNLIVLNLDFIEENRISLKTEFCEQNTEIRDISLSQELFYILLAETEFPIQVFSREGILTRCVVKKDSINSAFCFCLDQQQNILVADLGDSKVKIFSNEGKLLTQFGKEGSEEGQFEQLKGISLFMPEFIVTTDTSRKKGKLQFFKRM